MAEHNILIGCAGVVFGLWLLLRRRPSNLSRGWMLRPLRLVGVVTVGLGVAVAVNPFSSGVEQVAELKSPIPADSASIERGQQTYQENCLVCHGARGRGDGAAAITLNPRPADLRVHMAAGHPDSQIYDWVSNGVPGTGMPGWQDKLSSAQRWDVINYIKTFATPAASPGITSPLPAGPLVDSGSSTEPAAASQRMPTPPPTQVVGTTPIATAADMPLAANVAQERRLDDLIADIQVAPRVFHPSAVEIRLRTQNGQPPTDIRRVDVTFAMEGMNHGAYGVEAKLTAPGVYQALGMMVAMEGRWHMALRIERSDGRLTSTVFTVNVPSDTPDTSIPAMSTRPTSPTQIEDVAVYPEGIIPSTIAVQADRPVRLEIMYVDQPPCGNVARITNLDIQVGIASDGLGELSFIPPHSGSLQLTCTPAALDLAFR
ncbi:MAG: c-type cytochrome [Anaerolineae bacterium]